MPGVFAALAALARRGYRLVMVTNQDGLGSEAQQFILDAFRSQGIAFEAVFVCPPQTGLVQQYLREREVDLAASAVIGDRHTDLEFAANLKVRGITVRRHGPPHETWPAARVAIDLSGRAFAQFSGRFPREAVGALPTELVPHFFRSLAEALGAAIHVSVTGENTHHMIEACFKGVGRALRQGLRREGTELPSTKGAL